MAISVVNPWNGFSVCKPPNPGSLSAVCAAEMPAWALLYCELAMWEPVVDARRLLGPEGIVPRPSTYLQAALRKLADAPDWATARGQLQHVHQLAHEDEAVIALWQLTDHYAYHKSLQGMPETAVRLYDSVEQWRPSPWFPSDE